MLRAHEADWARFEASKVPGILYVDVPWPDAGLARPNALLAHAMQRAAEAGEGKTALRKLQVRWHPDKWSQRYAARLCAAHAGRVLARVKEIAQVINGLAVSS